METAKGWPLGLGSMTARIRVDAGTSRTTAPPQPLASRILPSTSFTSVSSSNLDTESTASFFPDRSVPLGRLIGIRPSSKQSMYPREQPRETTSDRCRAGLPKGRENSEGVCAPLLHHVIGKMGRSGTASRR
ncbi:hypothetical protein Salat_2071200 [Sesamum alatum]|uniref:Uncharacterized protein n=1 Tax=Sesamum alatum TaxID=300844 RepID=A0AAE1Y0E2_9LAMI|nr:hypothetical protein Salat_2071200 [Sesamum alatum]